MSVLENVKKCQHKHLLKGLCICCGNKLPIDYPYKQCGDCLQKRRSHQHEIREKRKQLGLCPRCGKDKLLENHTVCEKCFTKTKNNNKKRRSNRKNKGLCAYCGKNDIETSVYCRKCIDYLNKLNRLNNQINGKTKNVPNDILHKVRIFFGLKNIYKIHKKEMEISYKNNNIKLAIAHIKAMNTCKDRLKKEYGYDIENA